ncbi:MAG: helix-turn-helix transcriptional regulator [Bacteroidales bacterium]|nr:helix-turn-helix transcriptional regulator [Bacteroidales bacterium]
MGNNIRKLRIANKVTQKEIMEKLHINDTSLSRMEKGIHSISDQQAIALADFFKVSIDYLLGREWEDKNKEELTTKEFEYKDILKKLETLNDKELSNIAGAIDYILEKRDNEIGSENHDNFNIDHKERNTY